MYVWVQRVKVSVQTPHVSISMPLDLYLYVNISILTGVGFIDNVRLGSARQGLNSNPRAVWVEECSCPEGYIGQFCESCAPGYRREVVDGGPFAKCVPCQCNGQSDICDVNTGE